jgi:membrane-associated phospholipid phosphatase
MFQTELHHALQTLAHPFVVAFANGINALGYKTFYLLILFVLIFGVDFKRGFVLLHVVVWNATITAWLKDWLRLPRPIDVDYSLKVLETNYNNPNTQFLRSGAPSFWAPLPPEVLAYYQAQKMASYGFPSGHVSGATAFFGAWALAFRQWRWLIWLALGVIVLMPWARMFVGQHFLADVLGGLAIGSLIVALAYTLCLHPKAQERLSLWDRVNALKISDIWVLYLLLSPLAIALLGQVVIGGQLMGANLVFLWLSHRGFPQDNATWVQRLLRVLLALLLYGALAQIFKRLDGLDWLQHPVWQFSLHGLSFGLLCGLGVALAQQWGLYGYVKTTHAN